MTHPHEGLQERALREALEKYDKTVKDCPANRMHLGDKLCPTCNAGPDEGCRKEIMAAGDVVRAARSSLATLPQQAATDEGEAFARVDDPSEAVWNEWTTPTSQPPAAETRLREAVSRFLADYDDGDRADAGTNPLMEAHIADFRAALTQPEPTAQQGGEEAASAMGFNAAFKEWYGKRGVWPRVFPEEAFEAGWIAALSTLPQQAAGEEEAFASEPIGQIRVEANGEWILKGWATNLPEGVHWLYATPQPTETQRIVSTRDLERKAVVAWLRTASQSARDHHAEVCHRLEDDEILDAIITRMETYAFAADQIERGVHFPSGEHLAGERQ